MPRRMMENRLQIQKSASLIHWLGGQIFQDQPYICTVRSKPGECA